MVDAAGAASALDVLVSALVSVDLVLPSSDVFELGVDVDAGALPLSLKSVTYHPVPFN